MSGAGYAQFGGNDVAQRGFVRPGGQTATWSGVSLRYRALRQRRFPVVRGLRLALPYSSRSWGEGLAPGPLRQGSYALPPQSRLPGLLQDADFVPWQVAERSHQSGYSYSGLSNLMAAQWSKALCCWLAAIVLWTSLYITLSSRRRANSGAICRDSAGSDGFESMQVDTRQPNADLTTLEKSMKKLCWLWPLLAASSAAFAQSFVTPVRCRRRLRGAREG